MSALSADTLRTLPPDLAALLIRATEALETLLNMLRRIEAAVTQGAASAFAPVRASTDTYEARQRERWRLQKRAQRARKNGADTSTASADMSSDVLESPADAPPLSPQTPLTPEVISPLNPPPDGGRAVFEAIVEKAFVELRRVYGRREDPKTDLDKPALRALRSLLRAGKDGKPAATTVSALLDAARGYNASLSSPKFRHSLRRWLQDGHWKTAPAAPPAQASLALLGLAASSLAPSLAPSGDERWDKVRGHLIEEIGEAAFLSWFGAARLESVEDDVAQLSVGTRFIQSWIKGNYLEQAIRALSLEVGKIYRLNIVVRAPAAAKESAEATKETAAA